MTDNETLTPSPLRGNVPELTVSELAFSLKRTLEDTYSRVRVRGELSKVKIHSSGHLYSDLKDADAVLNIVCWKGTLGKLGIRPEEGLDVICTGKITSYPARSNYQMIIDQMELAGEGALLKLLEDRKKRLASEGLFDQARKKPIPYLPETIGVITSPTGAVIRDILHRISDRCPRTVLLWPVRVQGAGAAEEIAAAINGMNALTKSHEIKRPDVIIVARGGGSLEDLMAFNEEVVVRAAAKSEIPLISAIGHETDTTLIDFASDLRAPTPTAAAEMAVPERTGLLDHLKTQETRLFSLVSQLIRSEKRKIELVSPRLGGAESIFNIKFQALDHLNEILPRSLERKIAQTRHLIMTLYPRLTHPKHRISLEVKSLEHLAEKLYSAQKAKEREASKNIGQAAKMLDMLSFKSTLKRGFALVRDQNSKPLTGATEIGGKQMLQIEFHDGLVKTKVEDVEQIA